MKTTTTGCVVLLVWMASVSPATTIYVNRHGYNEALIHAIDDINPFVALLVEK